MRLTLLEEKVRHLRETGDTAAEAAGLAVIAGLYETGRAKLPDRAMLGIYQRLVFLYSKIGNAGEAYRYGGDAHRLHDRIIRARSGSGGF
jgi:hypothetical protein